MYPPHDQYVLIGVDPGKMTGVYVYFEDGVRDASQYPREEIALHLADSLRRWAASYGPHNLHIAVEKYIITPNTAKLSQQTDALEVTGMVKGIAQVNRITDVRQYLKSNLKYAGDGMLADIGWYPMGLRHAADAARQTFALLREVDPPVWSKIVADASLESEDEGRKTP
jgi:hypothetical protein